MFHNFCVLYIFQNLSSETVIETDIVGECETEYSPKGGNWATQTTRLGKTYKK